MADRLFSLCLPISCALKLDRSGAEYFLSLPGKMLVQRKASKSLDVEHIINISGQVGRRRPEWIAPTSGKALDHMAIFRRCHQIASKYCFERIT